ncbi:MAG: hypothetical protein D3907_09415 [Candidatus Electrothrix sp. AUS3]|nr:hypothetical protein [Candidatus Electrothrix gigas]
MKVICYLVCWLSLFPFFVQANENTTENKMELLKFLEKEHVPSESLLPDHVTVMKGFKPGTGVSVGEVQDAHGTVLVIHHDSAKAYRLQKKMPVFRGDTLITEHNSRVTLLLLDKSVLSLDSRSKMLIKRSFYDVRTQKERRNTKLQLFFGKLRSFVSKITGDSDYTVTTPTALAGVRGTDFALVVGPVSRKPSKCEAFSQSSNSLSFAENEGIVTSLITVLVTGDNSSSVEFSDPEGKSSVIVDSLSVTGVLSGCTGTEPSYLGKKALDVLRDIGPQIDQLQEILTAQQHAAEFLSDPLQRDVEDLIQASLIQQAQQKQTQGSETAEALQQIPQDLKEPFQSPVRPSDPEYPPLSPVRPNDIEPPPPPDIF